MIPVASPIRLLHVLEATVGGTRRHLLDLCQNLPRERFQQHLVYSSIRSAGFESDAQRLREAGIEATPLPMRREIEPAEDWHCLQALTRIIQERQPQIVHGHSAKGGFLARLAAHRVPSVRTVYNPHGFPFQMRTSALKHHLYIHLERHAARYTDALVAACEGQKAIALQCGLLPPERISVIPNGINSDEFSVPVDREAIRRELGVPPEAPLVGTVAALSPQKGLDYLIRAAAAVRRERPETHFLLVGEGVLRGSLERLAKSLGVAEGIHFAGARTDVPRVLAALDLFVLPSLWEGLPYALLEAGAAGLPVIATDIPGNCEVIRRGETGYLAKAADALDLTVRLFEALDDPASATVAAALQQLVRTEYTLERMIAGHVELYEKLVVF